MRELVGAIGEYGEHLQSYTAVVRSLAAATGDLQATTSEMREVLASLTALLRSLAEQREPLLELNLQSRESPSRR